MGFHLLSPFTSKYTVFTIGSIDLAVVLLRGFKHYGVERGGGNGWSGGGHEGRRGGEGNDGGNEECQLGCHLGDSSVVCCLLNVNILRL